jgi:hypothetical protein
MTDISKYKNVTLSKEAYAKLDKIRRVIAPPIIVSRSQTVAILIEEKAKSLNGKMSK